MKILLDENVPRELRKLLPGHDVYTVQYKGWSALKNGALLKVADIEFDVFLTVDKNIKYQQNFTGYKMCFVTLMPKLNKMSQIHPLIPELRRQLSLLTPGSGTVINILPP